VGLFYTPDPHQGHKLKHTAVTLTSLMPWSLRWSLWEGVTQYDIYATFNMPYVGHTKKRWPIHVLHSQLQSNTTRNLS